MNPDCGGCEGEGRNNGEDLVAMDGMGDNGCLGSPFPPPCSPGTRPGRLGRTVRALGAHKPIVHAANRGLCVKARCSNLLEGKGKRGDNTM